MPHRHDLPNQPRVSRSALGFGGEEDMEKRRGDVEASCSTPLMEGDMERGGEDMEYSNMRYAYNKYLSFQFSRRKFEK